MFQVNRNVHIDGQVELWISEYSENGYKGRTTNTTYTTGTDFTDWCIFVGTEEECLEYIG